MKLPAHIFYASVCGRGGLELCRALVTFTDYAPLPIYYEQTAQLFLLFLYNTHVWFRFILMWQLFTDLRSYFKWCHVMNNTSYFPWKLKVVRFSKNEWHVLCVCLSVWSFDVYLKNSLQHNFENTGETSRHFFLYLLCKQKLPPRLFSVTFSLYRKCLCQSLVCPCHHLVVNIALTLHQVSFSLCTVT